MSGHHGHHCKHKEKCCKKICPFQHKGCLPCPESEACGINFYPILTVDPACIVGQPMVSIKGTDGNFHFPGEQFDGTAFWFIITAECREHKLVIVIPEKSKCTFPEGSPFLISFNLLE